MTGIIIALILFVAGLCLLALGMSSWVALRREQERHSSEREEEARRIEREETDLVTRMRREGRDPEEFLAMLESFPPDVEQFHGYVDEVKRRWIERQLKKSVDVTRDRLQATANLYAAYADIQRRKREMVREHEAFKSVRKDLENDVLRRDVEREKLLAQRAQFSVERARVERDFDSRVHARAMQCELERVARRAS